MTNRIVKSFICSENEPVVTTKAGKIRGYKMNEIYTFLGVRYAEAERFKMPKPVTPWEGVIDTQDYGYQCPQTPPRSVAGNLAFPKRYWPESEDCQYLNVWTTELNPKAKKPVMIWLHGGGFASGSCVELECYDGENMARYGDVVAVSLNHRLNILGYLDLSDYGEEYELSGIVGMEDVVVALKWVHDNISLFGGDPDNVTIFGESGGGAKVRALMQMASADGLYRHAIVESGIMGPRPITPAEEKEAAKDTAKKIVDAAGGLDNLLAMPYAGLLEVIREAAGQGYFGWGPVPCTGSYVGEWYNAGFRKETLDIPVIAGSVFQELVPRPASIRDKNSLSEDERFAALVEAFGEEHAAEIRDEFKKAYPELNLYYASLIDHYVRRPTSEFCARRIAAGGEKTYNFMFAFETWFKGGHLSTHADELAFVFHNAEYIGAMYAGDKTLKAQDEIFYAWMAFARTGNPNHNGISEWKMFSNEHNCFVFSAEPGCRAAHDEKLMELVEKYRVHNFGFGARRKNK